MDPEAVKHVAVVPTPPTTEEVATALAESNARYPPHTTPKDYLSMFRCDGKVAVITGGAGGLGYCMAEGLCSVGLKAVAILDLQESVGQEAVTKLRSLYSLQGKFYKVDVTNETSVNEVIDAVVRDFGSVDILVNSAGVADLVKAEEYPAEKFRRVVDINLNGSFLVSQACGRHMIARKRGGSIIFIASMSGTIVNWPQPQCAYNASKAGVKHLMKSLAAEWAAYGIRCNAISPGYMETALNRSFRTLFQEWCQRTPQGRLGAPDELCGATIWLASEASAFCTGSDIVIDGGYTAW
ncbi:NAD(P)-binding protein [Basidiobolus meristosporus CBS 931.73]|uniref:NAD(P)-binding protein n=1 Tax=Basidiobolus meristosporus CBS 931.73 TaxID=1314790 RepID=A0A1Y1XUB3_9FUNG|nr:NAD(P)-binding protein [Basidiobolus meristosporus CBS 931.73]ORX94744.1 NAD(P)-binding protein [Basidiobolus meristosporus CBS 931.73]|eukprot:ORX89338.1 NAD(P)-binding protein [Basidiobolus meristosporus CBS 931.73]